MRLAGGFGACLIYLLFEVIQRLRQRKMDLTIEQVMEMVCESAKSILEAEEVQSAKAAGKTK